MDFHDALRGLPYPAVDVQLTAAGLASATVALASGRAG
jgi:hypothetical protein